MAKTIATLFGVVLLLVGLIGFAMPGLLGAHLSPAHNVVHLVTGAISLFIGVKGTVSGARMFGLVFGAVYLLLGVAGFALGAPHADAAGHTETLFRVVPGVLELGLVDHVIHLAVGGAYLIGALMTGRD